MSDDQIETLLAFEREGFPDNKELAAILGRSERAVSKILVDPE